MKLYVSQSPIAKRDRRRKRALERIREDVAKYEKQKDEPKLKQAKEHLANLSKKLGV